MGENYTYMRISTQEERGKQKFTRQEKALESYAKKHGITYLMDFKEDVSGKSFTNRIQWNKLERIVQPGDTIFFKDVSRFTREAENGFCKYMELYEKKISLVFLDNPTMSTDYIRDMLDNAEKQEIVTKTVLQAIVKILLITEMSRAENERLKISERTKDGIAARKREAMEKGIPFSIGRKPGQLLKLTPEVRTDIEAYIQDRRVKPSEIMKKHNISYNTLRKYADIIREENGQKNN